MCGTNYFLSRSQSGTGNFFCKDLGHIPGNSSTLPIPITSFSSTSGPGLDSGLEKTISEFISHQI